MKKLNLEGKQISVSPYSNSWYVAEPGETIDWGHKPEGSLRVSDHWGWQDQYDGTIHCPVEGYEDTYLGRCLVCEYKNGKYHITDLNYQETLDAIIKHQTIEAEKRFIEKQKEEKKRLRAKKEETIANIKKGKYSMNFIFSGDFRTYETRGTGRNTRTIEVNRDLLEILKIFNVKFSIENDAPRGGKLGDYVKVNLKSAKKLEKYL